MNLASLQQRLFMALLYLYQASSSNTQNFLRKVFSVRLSKQSWVSPDLLDIMWFLNLILRLYLELCWTLILFSSAMMPQNLFYLLSTEDLIECSDGQRNFLFSRSEINQTQFLWTD